jgi:hypothetical protein
MGQRLELLRDDFEGAEGRGQGPIDLINQLIGAPRGNRLAGWGNPGSGQKSTSRYQPPPRQTAPEANRQGKSTTLAPQGYGLILK